jgi:hypothetical protein
MFPGSIMFHVRRRPADSQPRRRKKKTAGMGAGMGAGGSSARPGCEPVLVELAPDGTPLENGRRVRITGDLLEVFIYIHLENQQPQKHIDYIDKIQKANYRIPPIAWKLTL